MPFPLGLTRPPRLAFALFSLALAASPAAARSKDKTPRHPCLEAAPLAFGEVQVGTRAESTLTVRNRCPRPVSVTGVSGGAPDFSASLPSPVRIPARGAGTIPVAFSPTDTGAAGATLTLRVDRSKDRAYARVSGRGIAAVPPKPSLTIAPASVSLAMGPAEMDTFRLAITNNGTSPRAEILVDAIGEPIPRPERGWRVLYLNTVLRGTWEDGMMTVLKALDNVDTAEAWDGTRSLPSLSRLLEYDVVVVGTQSPWKDSANIDPLLAGYVEAGGKVLLTASALNYRGHPLRGYFVDEYSPLSTYNTTYGGPSGALADHPITQGVGAFTSGGVLDVTTQSNFGADILGTYANGIFVGASHKDLPVVVLNISTFDFSGDIPRLVKNTLDYLGSKPAWMMPRPPFTSYIFVVPEGETRELVVTVASHRLARGTYRGAVEVYNASDTDAVPVEIPVTLDVTARRLLALDPAAVDFDSVWQGSRAVRPVRLVNAGNLPTEVTGFVSGSPAFSVAGPVLPLVIPAFSAVTVDAAFAPAGLGPDSAAVEIQSDAEGDVEALALKGRGIAPPVLDIDPAGLEASIAPGDSAQRTLRIRNPGGDSLRVALRPVADSAAGTPGTGPEKLDVLFVHTTFHSYENPSDFFMWHLLSEPQVDTLVGFRAVDSLPSLEYMQQFDAVLVMGGVNWADPEAMGNRLAEYVDAGGRVCLVHASLNAGEGGLTGRITGPEYSPVAPTSSIWSDLGGEYPATLEDHPITRGIDQSLRTNFVLRATETQGAGRPLGRYESGYLVGAYNALKPVVYLNVYPHDGFHYLPTTSKYIGNALGFLGDFHTWLQPSTRELVLAPGGDAEVTVTFGLPSGPGPGSYAGRLELRHNAPGSPDPLTVPATLTVTGTPTASSLPVP